MTFPIFLPGSGHHPSRPDHPERVFRVPAAMSRTLTLPGAKPREAQAAALDAIPGLHAERYLAELARPFGPGEPARLLDGGDTSQAPGSLGAALEGVGAAMQAIDEIASGAAATAFVATRPPGHHACRTEAMGFCLLGTAALAAAHARDRHGFRVAVLDFDVHHGNGTQDLLSQQKGLFLASSQARDIWPFTGQPSETGCLMNIRNELLPRGSGDEAARETWSRMLAWVEKLSPDLLVVSAGFDAHEQDPLGILSWSTGFYGELGARIRDVAGRVAGGRVLSILEGGYDLGVLSEAVPRYAAGLLGCAPQGAEDPGTPGSGMVLDLEHTPYLVGRAPAPSGQEGFSCMKAYSRLWVQDNRTGHLVYTPPPGRRLINRAELQALADDFSAAGGVAIDAIVAFEAKGRRKFR